MRIPVDIHTHILPSIDDGASGMIEARSLLEAEAASGVKHLVFTPHYYPEGLPVETFLQRRTAAAAQVEAVTEELEICFRLGAEIHYVPDLDTLDLEKLAFTGTSYVLIELPDDTPPADMEGMIRRIVARGFTPILAHIERCSYFFEDPTLLYAWVCAGALTQINAAWILKDKKALKWAKRLCDWNLVHFMASDSHNMVYRQPNLEEAYKLLPEKMAGIFDHNGRVLFRGQQIRPRKPVCPTKHLGKWA